MKNTAKLFGKSVYFEDLFSENANNTKQNSQNEMHFMGFETHLLNKKRITIYLR